MSDQESPAPVVALTVDGNSVPSGGKVYVRVARPACAELPQLIPIERLPLSGYVSAAVRAGAGVLFATAPGEGVGPRLFRASAERGIGAERTQRQLQVK